MLFIIKWAWKTNHFPLNLGATMGIHVTHHFQSLWYLSTCNDQDQNFNIHSFSHSDKPLQMYIYCQDKGRGVGLLFCFLKISFLSCLQRKQKWYSEWETITGRLRHLPPLLLSTTPKKKSAKLISIPAQHTAQLWGILTRCLGPHPPSHVMQAA